MSTFFLYARKSTESEDRQVLSIEAQLKEMKQTASRFNLKIKEILTESKSAKEPGRPVFNDMMKRLYKGEADGLLCWKLDRLARNPIDGASIIWAMKQHGIKIYTPSQSYSHEDENTILLYIEFGMAQKYIDDLSKNVTRGLRMKLEKGGWPSLAPLGYLNDRASGNIVKDPERFELVRKMWDLMLSGSHSIERITEIANNEWGFRTRKLKRLGGRPITKSTVYKILTNPFYYGFMRHNLGFYKGNHKPMVTREEFNCVQELLGRNDRPKSKNHYFPFAGGLIKCGVCGCSITAEYTTNRHGSRYTYYHCSKKSRSIKCPEGSIRVERLEQQFAEFLKSLEIDDRLEEWILKNVEYLDTENQLISADKLKSLGRTLEDNERQTAELNRMRYKGLLEDQEFLKEKASLLQEKQSLEERLECLQNGEFGLLPLVQKTIHVARYANLWFQSATPKEKREIIETVGSNPILKDKNVLIQAQIPFTVLKNIKKWNSVKNSRFEPQSLGKLQPKRGPGLPSGFSWSTEINDLRTFWEEDFTWRDKFEHIYGIFVDKDRPE